MSLARLLPLPWLILATALGITWTVWDHERMATRNELRSQFDFALREEISRVEQRMSAYEQMLRGVQAWVVITGATDRGSFRDYVEALQLDANFSGARAIGVATEVPAASKEHHVAAMHRLGVGRYAIHPEGPRESYAPVTQLEPDIGRNAGGLGFDAWTDPVRRSAMELARDSGKAAITGKLRLGADAGTDPEPGFVMYLPVYAYGQPHDTVAQRRANIAGWVFALLHMNDLMASLYGEQPQGLAFAIYDGVDASDTALLFRSVEAGNRRRSTALAAKEYLVVAGHTWLLSVIALDKFEARFGRGAAPLIAGAGTGLSLLLALLAWLLLTGRTRALQLAADMTRGLRESEEKFRAIANCTVNWEVWWGLDGTPRWINPSVEEYTGYTVDECMAMPDVAGALFHPDDLPLAAEAIRNGLQGLSGSDLECRCVRKDGSLLWLSISWAPIHDAKGAFSGFRTSGRDITALKQAREALRAREERFRILFDRASDGIMIMSPGGKVVAVNESFARMHGYTTEEMQALNLKDLDTPDTAGLVPGRMQRVLAGETATFEVRHLHKDGHVFPLEVSASLIVSDGEPLIQCFHRDIAERKRAEEALRHSEEKFAKAFRASPALLAISTVADDLYIEVNEGFLRGTGHTRGEVIGHTSGDIALWDSPQDRQRAIDSLRENGHVSGFEAVLRNKSAEPLVCEIWAEPIVIEDRPCVIWVANDISDRKEAEAARERLEAQLRESQKMEALGTLAGGVAHDFNNALAAILGNVELVRQDVGAGHAALVSLDEIGKASRRAKDLVRQILAFGRRQKLERKATSLALVVVETARLIRATLPARVSLNVDCSGDAPVVLADATQIEQVLLNLCSNALQAVQDQGRPGVIEIFLEAHTQGETRSGLRAGRYARLTVRDNGSGMCEPTRLRMFEPFFTTKPVGKGTGLGLSVVHGIVQAHDASVEVESVPGAGTTFAVYFPAVDAHAPVAVAPTPETAPAHGEGRHVLYVDDEEAIIFLMKRLLERRGYRVSGYTDPREALLAVRADPDQFDLAVTDYNMPGMSGLELARALRQIRADLPVVLASGYITEELRAEAPAAGICELIYKPNAVDDLCEAVARAAAAHGA